MKSIAIVSLAAAAFFAATAHAQTNGTGKPAEMTCAEFLDVNVSYRPALVYWIASVDRLGVREDDTIEIDDPHVTGYLAEECRKSPADKLAPKVNKVVKDGILSGRPSVPRS